MADRATRTCSRSIERWGCGWEGSSKAKVSPSSQGPYTGEAARGWQASESSRSAGATSAKVLRISAVPC